MSHHHHAESELSVLPLVDHQHEVSHDALALMREGSKLDSSTTSADKSQHVSRNSEVQGMLAGCHIDLQHDPPAIHDPIPNTDAQSASRPAEASAAT